MRKRANEVVLRPVHPNAGIAADYRRRILCLIDEMARSYAYWLRAAYRKNEPVMAQDASPAVDLDRALRRLGRYWQQRFNRAAPDLAAWFVKSAARRSDAAMRMILKRAGIAVEFKLTAAQRDILYATLRENVGLIRTIPQQFHVRVQGMVMRSVQTGRDLQQLTKDLQKGFGVSRKRAELIARDQNNKATSALTRARQVEAGIEEAVWLHSQGGKEPRRTHLANSGNRYSVAEGWFDPDPKVRRRIWPGELINCRCVAKAVVRGFS